ncbi:hypothetical protein [Nocardia bovistercoris]|uniref:Uncharacterized protein n=1 Tax=Nocardia bovistercoris TaxID=2785916 RepID=A0A931IB53_9NOCA|nr:hypothetical protein [Nocardia bovistercoris]MBH0778184.1 hypothetical protein [Nocardia bovistercoris]
MQSELPAPDVLWGRTLVVQVVQDPDGSGQLGELTGGRVTFDMGYQDNWFTLVRYRGGKAVVFGRGRDETYIAPEHPQDLLAGAPPWVPADELTAPALREEIDFVRWWDGRWGHADRLESLRVDYETAVALYPLLESEQLVAVFTESLPGVTHEEVAALFTAAESGTVKAELLAGLDAELSDAVIGYLTRGGVMADAEAVFDPLPAPATGPRPRRRITSARHRRQLVDAMIEASEMTRNAPPDTPELTDLLARIELLHHDFGHVDFAFRVGRGIGVGAPRNLRRIPSGLRRLRDIEAGESGRWLFIRFLVTDRHIRVERAYDHWPSWYPRNPYDNDPDRRDLLDELTHRAPSARPPWAEIAADEYAYAFD